MKPTASIAALFNRSGTARDVVEAAAMPVVSRDANGSGASSSSRLRATLAVLALVIAAFGVTAASAAAAPLAAKMGSISNASYDSADVTGTISTPGGFFGGGTGYAFQFSKDPSTEGWTPSPAGFTEPGALENEPVGKKIEGLKGNTTYFVRLTANNVIEPEAIDPEAPPYPSFTTLAVDPPVILATDDASEVFSTSAKASGEVERPTSNPDPAFNVTKCRFEYISDADYAVQQSEVQELTVAATGGSFQLEYEGDKTAQIAFDASAATVQGALEGLPGFPAGALTVSGGPGDETASAPYILTFGGSLASQNVALVHSDGAGLSGDSTASNVSASTQGRAEGFDGAVEQECEQPLPFETPEGKTPVSAHLKDLSPSTTYHLRLTAENAAPGVTTKDAAGTFTTAPKVAAPTVIATDAATEVSIHGAKFSGEVQRPEGADPALDVECRFEFVTDKQFNEAGFAGAASAPCIENQVTAASVDGEGKQEVHAEFGGFSPATTWHLRLFAENEGGFDTKDAASTFTTEPAKLPTVTIDPVASGTYTTAHVSGTVTTSGGGSQEFFQISTDGGVSWTTFEAPLLNGEGFHSVTHDYTGLSPNTTYTLRIAATYSPSIYYEAEALGEMAFSPEPNPSITTEALFAPTATIDPVTSLTATTARLSGNVDSHAPAGQLSGLGKEAFATHWHFECNPTCPPNPANPGLSGIVQGEEGSQLVSVDAIRLQPNTFYEVKLTATSEGGSETTEVQAFETPLIPADVTSAAGASDGEGGYTIQGVIDSNNSKLTRCEFEWGPNNTYPNAFKAPCLPFPSGPDEVQTVNIDAGEGEFRLSFRGQTTSDIPFNASPSEVQAALQALSSVGPTGVDVAGSLKAYEVRFAGKLAGANVEPINASDGAVPLCCGGGASVSTATEGGTDHSVVVEAHLTGLNPDAHYHFRIFATNAAGESSSGDREFIPTLTTAGEPCANEDLRQENNSLALPECRAYEQVTPPSKGGQGAALTDYTNHGVVNFNSSAGNIANSGIGGYLAPRNRYVAVRKEDSWEPIANLNGSTGSPYSGVEGLAGTASQNLQYSADFLTSVWSARTVNNSRERLLLRGQDGSFTTIGYQSPTSNLQLGANLSEVFDGASSDLSHVMVNGSAGASTGVVWGPGVYEFVGTGNDQPNRVDLDNAGNPIATCQFDGGHPYAASGDAISTDGQILIFSTAGGCGGTNPPADQIWARVDGAASVDVSASQCTRPSADPAGTCNAPADATFQAATPDGSQIFFTTTQQLLNSDTDQTKDIYACDIPLGALAPVGLANPCASLRLVSGAATGAEVENVVRVSEDGSTVSFTAKGVLAENTDAFGEKAAAGDRNLYVWRTDAAHPVGQTSFVGRLVNNDLGSSGNQPQLTVDGRFLVFTTASPLVPTDTDNARDVYRYDALSGGVVRVSTALTGTGGNVDGFDAAIGPPSKYQSHPAATESGEMIVFTTAEPLSPVDGNGTPDVYLWKAGHVSLISSGSVGGGGGGAVIDASGYDIYFESSQQMSPSDGDSANDVYDARIGGGFKVFQTPICSGETCQGPEPTSPTPKSIGTRQPNPNGNVTESTPCSQNKVRRHGKCVKKPSKRHRRAGHKHAGHHRGASK